MTITLEAIDAAISGQAIGLVTGSILLFIVALCVPKLTRFSTIFFGIGFGSVAIAAAFMFYATDALARAKLSTIEATYVSYKTQALIVSFAAICGGLSANMLILHLTKRDEPFFGIDKQSSKEREIEDMIEMLREKAAKMPESEREKYLQGARDAITLCEILEARKIRLRDSRLEERLMKGVGEREGPEEA